MTCDLDVWITKCSVATVGLRGTMAECHLIVSNPPHRSPDPEAAAPYFNCTSAEVRMKLNFPAPEVWFAESEEEAARETATALMHAGIHVAWIPGSVLALVPHAQWTTAVAAEGHSMILTTADGVMNLELGDRIVAVSGEPPGKASRVSSTRHSVLTQRVMGHDHPRTSAASGKASSVAFTRPAAVTKSGKAVHEEGHSATVHMDESRLAEPVGHFLDVYAYTREGWRAARITQTDVDFSGLGAMKQPTARANIRAILGMLGQELEAHVDERLQHVAYRSSVVGGVALNQVLRSISPHLGDLPPMDLGSRLVFLTAKGHKP